MESLEQLRYNTLEKIRKDYIDKLSNFKMEGNRIVESGTKVHKDIEKGLRFNEGKLKWSLVDWDAFEDMVRVLEFGAKKYSSHNWKKGLKVTEILDSLQRHVNAILRGEDTDPESGLPHIGHLQCNAMFLGYMLKFKPEMDDRYIDNNKEINEGNDKNE